MDVAPHLRHVRHMLHHHRAIGEVEPVEADGVEGGGRGDVAAELGEFGRCEIELLLRDAV